MAEKWIKVSKESGTGNDSVDMTASAYTGREQRSATIQCVTAGGAYATAEAVQTGKSAFISVTGTSLSTVGAGGKVTISGTANTSKIGIKAGASSITGISYALKVNEKSESGWNGSSSTEIEGDPGATAQYTFEITVTVPANNSASSRKQDLTLTGDGVSSSAVTITQAAGTKTYSGVYINSCSYPDIPASGGKVLPTVTYSQTWGWNGSTTGGGTITSGASISYIGTGVNTSTGEVEAGSKGTTASARTKITDVRVSVNLNGKGGSYAISVYQAENKITETTYTTPAVTISSVADIPASGGSVNTGSASYTQTKTQTYSSGSKSTATITSGGTVTWTKVSASSLGTTAKSRTQVGTITCSVALNGKTGSGTKAVYQAANAATYGAVTVDHESPVELKGMGQTYTLSPKTSQTVKYTSGSSRAGNVTISSVVVNALSGFTLESNKVTVGENPTTKPRDGFKIRITATGEGGKTATKDVYFSQAGAGTKISITPDTAKVSAAGGTAAFTIKSNDDWSLLVIAEDWTDELAVTPREIKAPVMSSAGVFDAGFTVQNLKRYKVEYTAAGLGYGIEYIEGSNGSNTVGKLTSGTWYESNGDSVFRLKVHHTKTPGYTTTYTATVTFEGITGDTITAKIILSRS